MIEIERFSPAGKELARMYADKETYLVRIWPCHDDPNGNSRVKVKRNEGMWTPALSCKTEKDEFKKSEHCGHDSCAQRKECIYL